MVLRWGIERQIIIEETACNCMGDARGMGKLRIALILFACLSGMATGENAVARAGEMAGRGYPLRAASAQTVSASNDVFAAPVRVASAQQAQPAPDVPAAQPAPATAAEFERQPISFTQSGNRRQNRDGTTTGYAMPSIWPALFSVALVCAVFCTILYLVKKYLPGHRQMFSHPAMEVLGRAHIDQRRYVSLLRVGKRIVVVGVSPDEMRALSEITDEEEITGIMEVARPKTEAGLNIFQRLFQRNVIDQDKAETRALANEKAEELERQMASLRDRVKAIREDEEEQPTRHVDALG